MSGYIKPDVDLDGVFADHSPPAWPLGHAARKALCSARCDICELDQKARHLWTERERASLGRCADCWRATYTCGNAYRNDDDDAALANTIKRLQAIGREWPWDPVLRARMPGTQFANGRERPESSL